jgi:hypothetical protein
MKQYIVLFPISLDSGPLILPAPEGDPPVIVDEATLFSDPSEFFTNDERAQILIRMGVLVSADAPEQIFEARQNLKTTEKKAADSLKAIT